MTSSNFRIGSLFGRPVIDRESRPIGKVHDVRLLRDGPIVPGFGPALRIEGVIVGPGSLATRLGLDRVDITGPWPLDVWGRRAARRAHFIPWEQLDTHARTLVCDVAAADLRPAHQ